MEEKEEKHVMFRVPCGLMFVRKLKNRLFRGTNAVGFNGFREKTGLIAVRVGNTGTENDYARSFVSYSGGRIQDHKLVKQPSLVTTAMFWLRTKCKCANPEKILTPPEVFFLGKKMGLSGKSAVDLLNRIDCCPVCKGGTLENWEQLDPFDSRALAEFDDRDENGNLSKEKVEGEGKKTVNPDGTITYTPTTVELTGLTGNERLVKLLKLIEEVPKEKSFVVPGVVAMSRKPMEELLPNLPIYDELLEKAHHNVDDDGISDHMNICLLNELDRDADICGLTFAAEEYSVGYVDYDEIDHGIESPEDSLYRVKLQVFCSSALAGKPPRLKNMYWAKQKRATQNRVAHRGAKF